MAPLGTPRIAQNCQVFERGSGQHRVLLLPGGFCTALTYVDLVAEPALAETGITTLAVNPPGFADNEPPPGFSHSTAEYAELVERLVDVEGLSVLAGHSLSANILIEVAARGNLSVPIVLLDPCLRYRNEYRGVRLLRRAEAIPPLARRLYAALGKSFDRSMRGLIRPDRLEMIVADMQKTPPEQNRAVINGYFDHLAQYDSLALRLADATGEVHYVRGDAESIGFDREDAARIVAQPNVRTHTITNSDHFTMLDNPGEVAGLLADVVSGATPGDGSGYQK